MLIQAERRIQRYVVWPSDFEQEFEVRSERLYNSWWVEMRYRRDISLLADAAQVLADVGWLSNNFTALWTP